MAIVAYEWAPQLSATALGSSVCVPAMPRPSTHHIGTVGRQHQANGDHRNEDLLSEVQALDAAALGHRQPAAKQQRGMSALRLQWRCAGPECWKHAMGIQFVIAAPRTHRMSRKNSNHTLHLLRVCVMAGAPLD